jgi:hypothetical protein
MLPLAGGEGLLSTVVHAGSLYPHGHVAGASGYSLSDRLSDATVMERVLQPGRMLQAAPETTRLAWRGTGFGSFCTHLRCIAAAGALHFHSISEIAARQHGWTMPFHLLKAVVCCGHTAIKETGSWLAMRFGAMIYSL